MITLCLRLSNLFYSFEILKTNTYGATQPEQSAYKSYSHSKFRDDLEWKVLFHSNPARCMSLLILIHSANIDSCFQKYFIRFWAILYLKGKVDLMRIRIVEYKIKALELVLYIFWIKNLNLMNTSYFTLKVIFAMVF